MTSAHDPARMSARLLDWYDRHARALPWRVPPGINTCPDPYRVWLSEVMLQQTTVTAVKPYFETFTARWPGVAELAAADDAQVMAAWAGLGYYARARNLLKCARVVAADHGGAFPDTESALLTLPGIGPYTAAAIAAIAFDRPAVVLDGNIERVMARLHGVRTPLPAAKAELRALAASLAPRQRPGDYAQGVMDLGATICTPRKPACGLCPWGQACEARAAGMADILPLRSPKPPKPTRHGIAWLAVRPDGAVLLETRPASGLLGGMLGLPGTPWIETPPEAHPPFEAVWRECEGEVRHTFTHFHLHLRVWTASVAQGFVPLSGRFHARPAADLPSVMRKALKLGLPG